MRYLFYSITLLLASIPYYLYAQEDAMGEFVPLIGIPGVDTPGEYSIENYINILYVLAISVAAFLAVVKLILAGLQYILSDVVTKKEDAKTNIRTALIGLLIVLSAVLILNTINPQLTNLTALDRLDGVLLQTLNVAVVPEATTERTECEQTPADDGSTFYSCAAAEAACEDAGGRAFTRITYVECIMPNFTEAERAFACSEPQGCAEEVCPFLRTEGLLSGCRGWCNAQTNGVYDPASEICLYQNPETAAGPDEVRETIECPMSSEISEFSPFVRDCTSAIAECGDDRMVNQGDYIYCFRTE